MEHFFCPDGQIRFVVVAHHEMLFGYEAQSVPRAVRHVDRDRFRGVGLSERFDDQFALKIQSFAFASLLHRGCLRINGALSAAFTRVRAVL